MNRALLLLALIVAPLPAEAQDLRAQVEKLLDGARPGTRFGIVVAQEDGTEIVAIDPDGRYIPASNTKMLTTAAAFATLEVNAPDAKGGASVRIEGRDVILTGNGDARMSSAADCAVDCLATLADAVAAKTKRVGNITGDDTLFPDQRWSPGMSWNNIPTRSGTATSALTLDDNELPLTVTAGAVDAKPKVEALYPYYEIDNRAVTVAAGAKTDIGYDRDPNRMVLLITGTIAADAQPEKLRVGIDDPAHYAAWRLKALLEARGVKVRGDVSALHRKPETVDTPPEGTVLGVVVVDEPPAALARLTPPPLSEDLTRINKISQNLHAELALRRLGLVQGTGSLFHGLEVVKAMLVGAGLPRTAYDFSDGSGMSTYNRISPRGMVTLIRWITAQPWGAAWRDTLPVGGVDGTLSRRFKGTSLEGGIFAKTGTINASNALAGYITAKSGRTLHFAAYANDVPAGVDATKAVDAALVLIAEAN